MASNLVRYRRRGLASPEQCRQCLAPAYGLQALLAFAASYRCRGCRAGIEGLAGSRCALQRQGYLQTRSGLGLGMDCPRLGKLAEPVAGRRFAELLRRTLRSYRPGWNQTSNALPARRVSEKDIHVVRRIL